MPARSISVIADARRTKTSSGVLLELSMLEMEKQRHVDELMRIQLRGNAISGRVAEIEIRKKYLFSLIEQPDSRLVSVLPVDALVSYNALPGKFKSRRFSY